MTPALSRRRFLQGSAALWASAGLAPLAAGEPDETSNPVPDVDARIRQQAADAPLSMQFTGTTAEECRRWQARFAAKLRELLGPHRPPEKWETIIERVVALEDHDRHELVLVAPPHPPLPVYVLSPKGAAADGSRPAVLALHGHGRYGYDPVAGRDEEPGVARAIENANYDYGRQLVRRGYVVAAPCMTPFGRRLGKPYNSGDPCGVTFVRLQLLGKVLMANNLRDCLWALELLARHKSVDPERLGCVGLSYGGRMTMLTSALEPRIRVAVVSGALNVMQERIQIRYSCGAQVIPGLLEYGDVPEISSLIAPRHCVWEIGSRDGLIKPEWAEQALTRIRRAYQACDAADHLHLDRFEGGHRFSGDVAFPLLEKELRPQEP